MNTIPLTQGYSATVDDADYEALARFKWHIQKVKTKHGTNLYAARRERKVNGKRRHVLMHREILGCSEGVDHKDLDGLNNQRKNLRPCTGTQNQANVSSRPGTSQWKGVFWCKMTSKWCAQIKNGGTMKTLGRFSDERDAALAYNHAATELFGDFARLNSI